MLIGVYSTNKNPFNVMPKERVYYMAAEAKMQGCNIVFFTEDGVNYKTRSVEGFIREKGEWVIKETSFPDVLIDEYVTLLNSLSKKNKDNTISEKLLAADAPMIRFGLPGKDLIYKALKNSEKLTEYLIPYENVKTASDVFNYIRKNKSVVLKPEKGNQGKGILFFEKINDGYLIRRHDQEKFYKPTFFKNFITKLISKNSKKFIIQPYINCRTRNGNPYDFRVHLQRNGKGEWSLTKIYPRIGVKESILSNISKGGMTTDIDYFLKMEFEEEGYNIKYKLIDISFEFVEYMDQVFNIDFDELGVDLAIDDNGKIYTFEINALPQTKFHEAKRARKTIAYAKYYAEKAKSNELYVILSKLGDKVYKLFEFIGVDFKKRNIIDEKVILDMIKSIDFIKNKLSPRYLFLAQDSNIKEQTKMILNILNGIYYSLKEKNDEKIVSQLVSLFQMFDSWYNEYKRVINKYV